MRRKHLQIISLVLFGLIGLPSAIAQMSLRQAQQYLQIKGLYGGEIDGVAGPKTRQALIAYQKSDGLKVTGKFDTPTAEKLTSYAASISGVPSTSSSETVILVEEAPEVDIVEQDIEVVELDVDAPEQNTNADQNTDTKKETAKDTTSD